MIEKTKHIPDGKKERLHLSINHYQNAPKFYYPISDVRCATGESYVKEGQYVTVGEVIGMRHGGFFEQPIHSTVSGNVVANEKKLLASGLSSDCIVIENDKKFQLHESCVERTEKEIEALKKEEFIDIVKNSGLSGLGGSGFPTYIKLQAKVPVKIVLANGIECEPNILSDYELMLEKSDLILEGLTYAMRTLGAPKGIVAVKAKFPELVTLFQNGLKQFPKFDIEIKTVEDIYPQGWEVAAVRSATGVEIPCGTLPVDQGVSVFNVATLHGFYLAVKKRLPVTERYFSISGNGVKQPMNFLIPIGSSVAELVKLSGGYSKDSDNKVLVSGGPMMGTNLTSDDFVTTKTTTSLIVYDEEIIDSEPCIHCASCVYSCPVRISPVLIMNAYKDRDKDAIAALNVNRCIECGLCSYTCPSKIHLTETMRQAKRFIKK